jgi:hypothetical protein
MPGLLEGRRSAFGQSPPGRNALQGSCQNDKLHQHSPGDLPSDGQGENDQYSPSCAPNGLRPGAPCEVAHEKPGLRRDHPVEPWARVPMMAEMAAALLQLDHLLGLGQGIADRTRRHRCRPWHLVIRGVDDLHRCADMRRR